MSIGIFIVVNAILYGDKLMTEKSLWDLSADKFNYIFEVNTITLMLIAVHFLPNLNKKQQSIFVDLSAPVVIISDNWLVGWYPYRTSKAAFNMFIKNAAIEVSRQNKQAIIVGFHHGTVDINLSKLLQRNIADGKLFTPDYLAEKLSGILENTIPERTRKVFVLDCREVLP